MKAVYIAAPYRDKTPEGIKSNIERVKTVARYLADQGILPVVPHLALGYCKDAPEDWPTALYHGLKLLERCDAMLICGHESEGVRDEAAFAKGKGIPIYEAYNEGTIVLAATAIREGR